MPRKTPNVTRDYLKKVPLPNYSGNSYTIIEHETVIVNALAQLKLKGFTVEKEHYRSNNSGQVAIGAYHLTYNNDPELGMMFAWANSYDKSMRFKCAVGGFVRVSKSSIIGEDFSWSRKHTGTADQEMIAQVTSQIMSAESYYDNLVLVKNKMKGITIKSRDMAEFFGRAFFEKGLFSKEQIGIVRDEAFKPSYEYGVKDDSLWKYYNHMLVALKKAHPRTWMEEHLDIHKFVCSEFGIMIPVTNATVTSVAPVIPVQAVPAPLEELSLDDKSEAQVENVTEQAVEDITVKEESKVHVKVSNIQEESVPEESPVIEDKKNEIIGEEISDEDQKIINERMAIFGASNDSNKLNLPD